MQETLPFHAGERVAQELSGKGSPGAAPIRDYMPDQHRAFFALLPFFAIAAEADGWPVPTILSGAPGFIASPDARRLTIAASPAADDPIAPLLKPGARVGGLGIDLATRRRNRVNGRIASAGREGLEIEVRESFGNCPKYIQGREVLPAGDAGAPSPTARFTELTDADRAAIAGADCLFVASFAEGGVDISHRGGRKGFVRADGDRLTIPDFRGNRYFNTLGNLMLNPRTALLFIDFDRGDLLCLQGTAEVDFGPVGDDAPAGAERTWSVTVERGWRRPFALPLRWRLLDESASAQATGIWT